MPKKLIFSTGGKKYALTFPGLLVLIAAGVAVGLLCGELLCRVFVRFPNEKKYLVFSSLGYREIPRDCRDKNLFWRPDLEFRGRRYAQQKPVNGLRIICLGDSVTQGFPLGTNADLPPEQTYPYFLEEKLRTALPQTEIEVINAGNGGYSSLQGYRYLRDTLTQYNPNIVISWFGVDDYAPAIFFDDRHQRVVAHDRCKKENVLEYSKLYLFLKTMLFSPVKRVSERDFYLNCSRICGVSRRRGAALIFVVPFSVDRQANTVEYLPGYKQVLERVQEQYPCAVVDIVPRLRHLDPQTLFVDRVHANGKGNEIIAGMLLPVVREKLQSAPVSMIAGGNYGGAVKEL